MADRPRSSNRRRPAFSPLEGRRLLSGGAGLGELRAVAAEIAPPSSPADPADARRSTGPDVGGRSSPPESCFAERAMPGGDSPDRGDSGTEDPAAARNERVSREAMPSRVVVSVGPASTNSPGLAGLTDPISEAQPLRSAIGAGEGNLAGAMMVPNREGPGQALQPAPGSARPRHRVPGAARPGGDVDPGDRPSPRGADLILDLESPEDGRFGEALRRLLGRLGRGGSGGVAAGGAGRWWVAAVLIAMAFESARRWTRRPISPGRGRWQGDLIGPGPALAEAASSRATGAPV